MLRNQLTFCANLKTIRRNALCFPCSGVITKINSNYNIRVHYQSNFSKNNNLKKKCMWGDLFQNLHTKQIFLVTPLFPCFCFYIPLLFFSYHIHNTTSEKNIWKHKASSSFECNKSRESQTLANCQTNMTFVTRLCVKIAFALSNHFPQSRFNN